jgi:hypothetical protein
MNRLYLWWGALNSAARWRIMTMVVLLVGAIVPTVIGFLMNPDVPSLLLNLGSEMGGGFITFILIDMIVAQRDAHEARQERMGEMKQRLVHKLGSSINLEARRAAEELRMLGWLTDGSLEAVELIGANLEGVDLRGAVLRNARMYRANLSGARLYGADLSGSFLTGCNMRNASMGRIKLDGAWMAGVNLEGCTRIPRLCLTRVNRLKGATMPDGSRYDGCYRLPGDLEAGAEGNPQERRLNLNDPATFAAWYVEWRCLRETSNVAHKVTSFISTARVAGQCARRGRRGPHRDVAECLNSGQTTGELSSRFLLL